MWAAYIFLGLLLLAFAYWLITRFLFKRIEDEELIDLIGYRWKDLQDIMNELTDFYGGFWSRFFQYPGVSTLSLKLAKLISQGYLEKRRIYRSERDPYPYRTEYRQTEKRYRRKVKKPIKVILEAKGIA